MATKKSKNVVAATFKVTVTQDEQQRRLDRKARFGGTAAAAEPAGATTNTALSSKRPKLHSSATATDAAAASSSLAPLVGLNENLEKPYLRLTTYPNASNVRPLPVLIKALAHIKQKYLAEEDFEWANEQFKSLRQDLTVQRIQNSFVLEVYETHARLLLEQGDLNEFNQCQTMIHSLSNDATMMEHAAAEGDPQQPRVVLQQTKEAADEFAGYAILYALVRESSLELHLALQRPVLLLRAQQTNVQQQQQQQQHSPVSKKTKKNKNKKRQRTTTTATAESPDSNNNNSNSSSSSSPFGLYPCKEDHANKSGSSSSLSSPSSSTYQHALCVVRAVVEDDSLTFFRLYRSAPHMSAYIMDFLVKRVRQAAFERVLHAYVPVLGMEQVRQWLWFDDLEQTRRFCHQQGAVFVQDDGGPLFWIDCQASCQKIKRKQQKQQQQMAGSSKSKSLSSRG